MELAIMFENAS